MNDTFWGETISIYTRAQALADGVPDNPAALAFGVQKPR